MSELYTKTLCDECGGSGVRDADYICFDCIEGYKYLSASIADIGAAWRELNKGKTFFCEACIAKDAQLEKYKKLAEARDKYITFLDEYIASQSGFLYVHGQQPRQSEIEQGQKHRAEIQAALDAIKECEK